VSEPATASTDAQRRGLRLALLGLALPSDVQIELVPPFVAFGDELVEDFDLAIEVAATLDLEPRQRAALDAIDAHLDAIPTDPAIDRAWFFGDAEALRVHGDWQRARELARAALDAFDWPLEVPAAMPSAERGHALGTAPAQAYFVAQAVLTLAWWAWLMLDPSSRAHFRPDAFPDAALLSFWLPDLVGVVVGSFVCAVLLARGSRYDAAACCFTSGAVSYAALYCVAVSFGTGEAWWATIAMVGAALVSSLFAIGRVRAVALWGRLWSN